MKFKKHFTTVTVGLVVVFIGLSTAHATLVKALNIKQLTALSNQIVKVKVVKKEIVDDVEESGAIVNCYTLSVLDWIKGSSEETGNQIIIKQLADGTTQINGKTINQHFGFPSYVIGKSYLFFLPRAHDRTGLSAPIGLQQGVYEIKTDAKGREEVLGLERRLGILEKGIEASARSEALTSRFAQVRSEQSYEKFKELIQESMRRK